MLICNAPWAFTAVWKIVQGWLDEKTRKKIQLVGKNYKTKLAEYVDNDQLPTFLGGTNESLLEDDVGPWNQYEIVDGANPDDVVGIRKICNPNGPIFKYKDLKKFPNDYLPDGVGPQNIPNW